MCRKGGVYWSDSRSEVGLRYTARIGSAPAPNFIDARVADQ